MKKEEKCSLDIMLVEDDSAQAELFLQAMRTTKSKLQVSHASTVDQAIQVIKECEHSRRPRLVILDFNLPPKHGVEVLEYLRSSDDARLRHLPVIMLSSSVEDKDVWMAYEAGANCYLEKPTSWDATQQIVTLLEAFWCMVRLPRPPAGVR